MVVVTIAGASVAANTKTAEQLQGTQLAYAPKQGLLSVRAAAAAAGIRLTLQVGAEVVVDDQPISTANRWPLMPDDICATVGVRAGEQIRLFFRNDTGGAVSTTGTVLELM